MKFIVYLVLSFSIFSYYVVAEQDEQESVKVDEKVKDWSLNDTENKTHTFSKLREEKEVVVLIFLATQCPVVDDYVDRILALNKNYIEKKVQFVGIHSNKHETTDEIKEYKKEHKFQFPVLIDPKNILADYYQARRTPEVFVLDKEEILRYRGGIDDSRTKPENHYLRNVLELVLKAKPIPDKLKKTRAIGCTIKRVRKTDIDRTP